MKRILILIITLSSFISMLAKEHPSECGARHREQIESRRVAFISTEIGISPQEAIAFWPIYNTLHEATKRLRVDTWKTFKSISELSKTENYSKAEMEKLIGKFVANKEKEANLQKEYYNNVSKVLPIEKVAKLIVAEEDFRRQMIRMWNKPPKPSEEKEEKRKK